MVWTWRKIDNAFSTSKKKKNQTLNLGDCCWREWTNDQQVISNIIKKIMKHSKEKKKKKTPQKMML